MATNCHSQGILKQPPSPSAFSCICRKSLRRPHLLCLECLQRWRTPTPHRLICPTYEIVNQLYFIWKSSKRSVSHVVIIIPIELTSSLRYIIFFLFKKAAISLIYESNKNFVIIKPNVLIIFLICICRTTTNQINTCRETTEYWTNLC